MADRMGRAALLALLLSLASGARADPLLEPHMTIPPGGAGAPRVALTLDACMGRADQRILDALVENRIPATVFATARWLARNQAAVAVFRQNPDLFEIENHGARHVPAIDRPMRVFGVAAAGSPEAVREEIAGGAQAIRAATGRSPTWFRGATATYTASSLGLIGAMNVRVAAFSLAADGGAQLGGAATASRIARARDGEVILAHLNHPERPAGSGVVAGILALKRRGVRFVRLDEAGTASAPGARGGSAPSPATRRAQRA